MKHTFRLVVRFPALAFVVLTLVRTAWSAPQTALRSSGGGQDDAPKLIQDLKSKDLMTRLSAAENLGRMGAGAAKAVPALIDMLSDTEKFYFDGMVDGKMTPGSISGGDAAQKALVLIGPPAVDPLVAALPVRKDRVIRWRIATALGDIKDPKSVDPLIRALGDGDLYVRGAVCASLGQLKDPAAIGPLKALLAKERDADVRKAAGAAIQAISR